MADDVTLWHYLDDRGRDVIVSDFKDIPKQYQAAATPAGAHRTVTTSSDRFPPATIGPVHLPSLALGFVVAGALVGVFAARRSRIVTRVVLALVSIAAIGGLYFGWVMRTAGLGDDVLASPGRALDEARHAVDATNASAHAQESVLDKIDKTER